MLYTKPMIDQVFQIRKAAPDHIRAQIKLANPDLLDLLASVYWQLHDNLLRDLIKQLMSMAGPSWLSLLQEENSLARSNNSQQVYRGRLIHQEEKSGAASSTAAGGDKPKAVIYRGQKMYS